MILIRIRDCCEVLYKLQLENEAATAVTYIHHFASIDRYRLTGVSFHVFEHEPSLLIKLTLSHRHRYTVCEPCGRTSQCLNCSV